MAEESDAKPSKAAKAACPYCAEQILASAIVCKTCRRDIALPMSLKSANQALGQRVEELEAELAKLQAIVSPQPEVPVESVAAPPPRLPVIDLVGIYFALPTVVLVAAHYFLVVRFDTKLAWLRAASIALPALAGWMLGSKTAMRWYNVLALGIVVALASVFGMSTVIHFTDGDAILPDSGIAWRETIEYATSIALSYLLGSLLASAAHPLGITGTQGKDRRLKLARMVARTVWGSEDGKSLAQRIEGVEKLMTRVVAASTAAGAFYTGFKGIL
jgi:hypothetical protein